MRVRNALRDSDRAAIERIVRGVGVFREEEIAVALELVDVGLSGDDRGYRFVIAEDESDNVIGYACFGQAPMTVGVYDLYWIAVGAGLQRSGAGRAILDAVEHRVQGASARLLLIETEATAPYESARRFYLDAGYGELARIADYYRIGADKVIYGKSMERR